MTGFGTWIPGSFIDPILRNSIIVLFDVYELDRMISLIKLICVSQLVIRKIFFIHKIVSFEKIVILFLNIIFIIRRKFSSMIDES